MPWAVKFSSQNRLDGYREHFVFRRSACTAMMFRTRQEAREWIELHWAFLRYRPDLKAEPHGWKMPKPCQVKVIIKEVKNVG